jgi:hypothetical protein
MPGEFCPAFGWQLFACHFLYLLTLFDAAYSDDADTSG